MKCSVIRDLLPLYIDEVCSKDTKKLVEEHLTECRECRRMLEEMQKEVELPKLTEKEQVEAQEPFKLIRKQGRKRILAAILATVLLLGGGFVLIQQVDWLNQIFFPVYISYVNITETGKWEPVVIRYNEQPFSPYSSSYDDFEGVKILEVPQNIFVRWKRQAVNSVDNEGTILMRVKNMEQELITDEILLNAGEGVTIEELKKGEGYYVEIKAEKAGLYRIAFT